MSGKSSQLPSDATQEVMLSPYLAALLRIDVKHPVSFRGRPSPPISRAVGGIAPGRFAYPVGGASCSSPHVVSILFEV
jgi:hypothetical protein